MKKLSFLLILPCLSYADVIKDGSVNAIHGITDSPQIDDEGYRVYGGVIIGAKFGDRLSPPSELTLIMVQKLNLMVLLISVTMMVVMEY
ncbi:hypothetical protein BKK56_10455 [Rodentibacter genomosp. 2]|uniref:hypothetical protein n=1 Tax=Rodentibacter genomosp. 2 TaxID=1908266 RepID=UPI000987237F|nr:hypothetical protein BKK56_10455 [Rodentibacter genomosp. 2]